jgi:hypothetical protein
MQAVIEKYIEHVTPCHDPQDYLPPIAVSVLR